MVLINARFLMQQTTGVQRFAAEITRNLLVLRDDVTLIAPVGELIDYGLDPKRIEQCGKLGGHLWEQLELPRVARARNELIVNLTSTGPMWHRPQISTHHDITYVRHPDSFSAKFRALYSFLVPRVIASSDALITVSEFSRGELASHFGVPPTSFEVIGNGVDERFRPRTEGSRPGLPYFLAVSSPNAHKNFRRMLAAFERFSEQTPDIELLVVGSQKPSFSRQEYNQPGPRVKFLGRIDDDELIRLYSEALAFVFPSLYEGFGIPPLEAQQCGCPVIAEIAASMPEVLRDSALYFDPYSEIDIAVAMDRIANEPELRAQLKEAGFKNASRFSWLTSAESVSRLIDRLLASQGVR